MKTKVETGNTGSISPDCKMLPGNVFSLPLKKDGSLSHPEEKIFDVPWMRNDSAGPFFILISMEAWLLSILGPTDPTPCSFSVWEKGRGKEKEPWQEYRIPIPISSSSFSSHSLFYQRAPYHIGLERSRFRDKSIQITPSMLTIHHSRSTFPCCSFKDPPMVSISWWQQERKPESKRGSLRRKLEFPFSLWCSAHQFMWEFSFGI